MSILSSVAIGFFGRKLLDVGGWVGGVAMAAFGFYAAATPAQQAVIGNILTGKWQDITLGALVPFIIWAWGQFMSYKATVRPQIVTSDGQKIELQQLPPTGQAVVENAVAAAKPKRTIASAVLDGLIEKLNRNR